MVETHPGYERSYLIEYPTTLELANAYLAFREKLKQAVNIAQPFVKTDLEIFEQEAGNSASFRRSSQFISQLHQQAEQ